MTESMRQRNGRTIIAVLCASVLLSGADAALARAAISDNRAPTYMAPHDGPLTPARIFIGVHNAGDPAAPALAHITVGEQFPNETVTVGTDPVGAHVTFGRAGDAIGLPVDFTRIQPKFAASMPSGLPVSARYVTSRFGMRVHPLLGQWRAHQGVDLAAPMGAPILATSDGVVEKARWQGGYGLFLELGHGNGMETRYGHLSRLNVVPGQRVRKGDVIGFVGSTGMSTGPHLHYEMRFNGVPIDPLTRK